MIGTEIGSYRILQKLGEGGMGVVYKAVDTALDRPVAIKVLNAELAHNPELVQRFRAEAKAQANLNHTNLATLYTFLVQDDSAAMVMEFVDGETFEQMITRRGPLPSEEAVPLFRQVLLGMGFAHRAGIIHRDIKPSNLMLNRSGIVKVMDFGIAKVMGARGLTRTGTVMGTGSYMSPEQVMNQPVDIRSDVYSLGVTLYQMLTAHVPFEGDSDFKVMSDHVNTPPPLPTHFYPYVPKGVENAVLKALEKIPDERFQSVEEFGTALEHPNDFTYSKLGSLQAPRVATVVDAAVTGPSFRVSQIGMGPSSGQASSPGRVPAGPASTHNQELTPAQMVARFAVPREQATASAPPKPVGLLGTPQRKITALGVALLLILVAAALALKLTRSENSPASSAASPTPISAGQTPLEQRLANSGGAPSLSSSPEPTPAPSAQPAQPPITSPRPRMQAPPPVQRTYHPAPTPVAPAPVPAAPAPTRAPVAVPQAVVAFNVVHDHGGAFRPGGAPSCWGRLRIAGGRLEYHVVGTNDGRRDELVTSVAQIQGIGANPALIRNQQAFHIVLNGQQLNFIPQGYSGPQAAALLQQAIQGR